MDSIEHRVKRVVAEQLGLYIDDVKTSSDFVNDLGADSLDLVELVMGVEDEFEIEISDTDAERLQNVQQTVDYVLYRLGKQKTPEINISKPTPGTGVCNDANCEECEGFDINYEPQFKRELRLYGFVNHYFASGIQAGIQHGHAAVRLMRKYGGEVNGDMLSEANVEMVKDWADNHETFIILNGGMHFQMLEVKRLVEESGYPFAVFHESEEACDGVMTAIVCLLPDDIFNMRRGTNVKDVPYYSWTRTTDDGGTILYTTRFGDDDFAFVEMLKSKNMANP